MKLEVTQTAVAKLKEVMADNIGKSVRVFIQGIGWGGPKMGMALDEPKAGDQEITVEGISFIYNKDNENVIPDSIIDFQDSFLGRGFVVRPAVPGVC